MNIGAIRFGETKQVSRKKVKKQEQPNPTQHQGDVVVAQNATAVLVKLKPGDARTNHG